MSVELVIRGNHVTDLLAEVQNLAAAIEGQAAPVKQEPKPEPVQEEKPEPVAEVAPEPAPKEETPKRLSPRQQDKAVDEMVRKGEADERYDLLTKGRKKVVDQMLAQKLNPHQSKEDKELESMFGQDEPETDGITIDKIRDFMGEFGSDEEGAAIQENLIKIQGVLRKYVPEGESVRVGAVPEDKYEALFAELQALDN